MRFHDGQQAHRVVQAGFDVAGSPRCRAVIVTDLDGNRGSAALEVGADGCHEDTIHIFFRGLNADNGADTEHKGTYIQSCACAVGGYPCCIGPDCLYDGIDKAIPRERRHFHTQCGIVHTVCIQVGAEAHDTAVLCRIGLESLKNRL